MCEKNGNGYWLCGSAELMMTWDLTTQQCHCSLLKLLVNMHAMLFYVCKSCIVFIWDLCLARHQGLRWNQIPYGFYSNCYCYWTMCMYFPSRLALSFTLSVWVRFFDLWTIGTYLMICFWLFRGLLLCIYLKPFNLTHFYSIDIYDKAI